MNDPWLPLIAALSGKRTSTPSTWPVRTVHRLESYVPAGRAAPPRDIGTMDRRQALSSASK
jgi:hypothetical protein